MQNNQFDQECQFLYCLNLCRFNAQQQQSSIWHDEHWIRHQTNQQICSPSLSPNVCLCAKCRCVLLVNGNSQFCDCFLLPSKQLYNVQCTLTVLFTLNYSNVKFLIVHQTNYVLVIIINCASPWKTANVIFATTKKCDNKAKLC